MIGVDVESIHVGGYVGGGRRAMCALDFERNETVKNYKQANNEAGADRGQQRDGKPKPKPASSSSD